MRALEKIIYHRIPSSQVLNVDYTVDRLGTNQLSIMYDSGSTIIQFDDTEFATFKQEVADMNQYFMLPEVTVSSSSVSYLNDEESFIIDSSNKEGKIEVSKEPTTNAPYILIRTSPIRNYSRIIQIYLTEDQIDKLDEITIRDIPFVYASSLFVTENASVQPNIVFTLNSGEFINLEIPAGSLATFKTECQDEADFLNDPLTVQTSVSVSSRNVISQTIEADAINTVSVGHTSSGNLTFIQVVGEEIPDKLRRSVFTFYLPEELFLDLNDEVQLWT
jgi:hypothetical protein